MIKRNFNKRIVQVIPQLSSGGAERFVLDICNEMCKYNEVVLVVLFPIEELGFFHKKLDSSIRVYSLNKKIGFNVKIMLKIFLLILKLKPDVIHSHLNSFYYLCLVHLFYPRKVRIVHTIHNDILFEGPGKWGILFKRSIAFFREIKFVVISNQCYRDFVVFYKFHPSFINNGRSNFFDIDDLVRIEIDKFRKSKETKVFLNIGRVVNQKNQLMLIDTFESLISDGWDVVLLIIGAGYDLTILDGIMKNDYPDRIIYLGEKENVLSYLNFVDAFCLSSLFEGMPITVIESFMVGCIPICTPVGGLVDMINNGNTGYLSKDITMQSFKDSILLYLNSDANVLSNMSLSCVKEFSKYSMNECAAKYLNLYLGE